jgi:hypothetical protein
MKGRTPKIAAVSMALLAVILVSNRLGIVQGQRKKLPGTASLRTKRAISIPRK